jgi:predicted Na+-dependent transporter
MGNLAGLALIVLSVTVSSSNQQAALWDQHASFYVACALPHMIGLILAVALATRFKLEKPERVAVTVEGSYQSTSMLENTIVSKFMAAFVSFCCWY